MCDVSFTCIRIYRSMYVQCWIDLLRVVAKRADTFNHVILIRAGLQEIPLEVSRPALA